MHVRQAGSTVVSWVHLDDTGAEDGEHPNAQGILYNGFPSAPLAPLDCLFLKPLGDGLFESSRNVRR
jgi:hypothetical protein